MTRKQRRTREGLAAWGVRRRILSRPGAAVARGNRRRDPPMNHPVSSKQRERAFRQSYKKNPAAVDPAQPGASSASGNGQPAARPEPAKRKKYLREYFRWLWPYRWKLAVVFVLAVVTTGLDLVWPLAIKGVVDLLPKEM